MRKLFPTLSVLFVTAIIILGFATVSPLAASSYTSTTCQSQTRTTIVSSTTTTVTKSQCVTLTSQGIIGYVGCSNSEAAVYGYYSASSTHRFWLPYDTGGGTLDQWTNSTSKYWTLFDQQVQKYGQPSIVWVNICEHVTRPLTYADVTNTFALLRQHAPNATYYVSPLNSYTPSNICSITGPNGVADATTLSDEAVQNGLAQTGPILGPLTSSLLGPDLCHPNSAGMHLLGTQLYSFFG